jgi:(2Fe-2S) ferredoxin
MKEQTSPYVCHIFVCVNDRKGERKSCADGNSPALKDYFKEQVEARGWKPRVRVSNSGCLGLCAKGPNVILYPQKIWFSDVTQADADQILETVAKIIQG